MSKYPKMTEGESIRMDLGEDSLKFACCDCGMVHLWQFHHIENNVWDFAVFRDGRATGQLRRHKYGNLQKK